MREPSYRLHMDAASVIDRLFGIDNVGEGKTIPNSYNVGFRNYIRVQNNGLGMYHKKLFPFTNSHLFQCKAARKPITTSFSYRLT